mgnify:CR=1 FL=1
MRRHRKVKIVATLGPSSSDFATIRALFEAGADDLVSATASAEAIRGAGLGSK